MEVILNLASNSGQSSLGSFERIQWRNVLSVYACGLRFSITWSFPTVLPPITYLDLASKSCPSFVQRSSWSLTFTRSWDSFSISKVISSNSEWRLQGVEGFNDPILTQQPKFWIIYFFIPISRKQSKHWNHVPKCFGHYRVKLAAKAQK